MNSLYIVYKYIGICNVYNVYNRVYFHIFVYIVLHSLFYMIYYREGRGGGAVDGGGGRDEHEEEEDLLDVGSSPMESEFPT